MNSYVRDLWIKALPTYKQASGKLRDGEGYCVGAVLVDLHSQATGFQWEYGAVQGYLSDDPQWSYLGSTSMPPKQVLMWAQLHEDDFLPLMDDNDDGVTFPELALKIAAL